MHPLLLRQINRATDAPVPDHLVPLLTLISDFYREVEQERALLENALRVNSEELTAINDRLRTSSAQELAKQRALLQEVIDAVPDPIFIKNGAGLYQVCNQAVEALFGAAEADILGKSDFDFLEPGLAAQFRQRDQEVLARGVACLNEEWVGYPDGRRVCLETLKTPYVAPDGRLLGVIGIARDVTDRKGSEAAQRESEQRFRDVLEFAPIGMGVVTRDGRFLHVNQALCNLLGYEKAQLEGLPNREVAHPQDYPASLEQFKRLLRGEIPSVQRELRLLCRDGRAVWVNLSVVLQRGAAGEPRYFIAQVEDVTARREMRERDHFNIAVREKMADGRRVVFAAFVEDVRARNLTQSLTEIDESIQ
jgi:PAS domain S-box-containing protein